jgi:uncharacterized protein (DUF433 family)
MEALNYLEMPAYSPMLVSRLVGLNYSKVNRWLRGYNYAYNIAACDSKVSVRKESVIRKKEAFSSRYASFLELIDLCFIKSFLNSGISLQKLRLVLNEVETRLGYRHFALDKFFTDGKAIYLEMKNGQPEKPSNLMQLISNGQWVIADIIKQTSTQIDFGADGIAERWFPHGRSQNIMLDPRISFGAPSIVNKGIPTANIYDFYIAENKNIKSVRNWFRIDEKDIMTAVKFEASLLAA